MLFLIFAKRISKSVDILKTPAVTANKRNNRRLARRTYRLRYEKPNLQIAFRTDKALTYLHFEGSEQL